MCIFCFGILLGRLGFFQDDWHHVFYAYWQGAEGLQRFLLTDRGPFAWPVYAAFFQLLGFSPTAWHWALMFIRFLTVLVFWLAARRIWPELGHPCRMGRPSLLHLSDLHPPAPGRRLHPALDHVPGVHAVVVAHVGGAARPRHFAALTAAALLLEATHLAMIEYFSGLELARPVFLWLLFAG